MTRDVTLRFRAPWLPYMNDVGSAPGRESCLWLWCKNCLDEVYQIRGHISIYKYIYYSYCNYKFHLITGYVMWYTGNKWLISLTEVLRPVSEMSWKAFNISKLDFKQWTCLKYFSLKDAVRFAVCSGVGSFAPNPDANCYSWGDCVRSDRLRIPSKPNSLWERQRISLQEICMNRWHGSNLEWYQTIKEGCNPVRVLCCTLIGPCLPSCPGKGVVAWFRWWPACWRKW